MGRRITLFDPRPPLVKTTHEGIEYAVISLTRGYKTLIDLDDFDRINQYNWYTVGKVGEQIRAARNKEVTVHYIQFEVLNTNSFAVSMSKKVIDHKDRNPLHNWKQNLRIVTDAENMQNSSRHINRVGVTYHKASMSWHSYICFPFHKVASLGYWDSKEKAQEVTKLGEDLFKIHFSDINEFKKAWKAIAPKNRRTINWGLL